MHGLAQTEGHCPCCARYKKELDQLKQIIDLLPLFVFVKNDEGRFLMANTSVAEAYGLTPEQMTGKLHSDIHPDKAEVRLMLQNDQEVISTGAKKIISAQPFLKESTNGQSYLRIIKIPYEIPDEPSKRGVLGVGLDITEYKALEEKSNKMNDLLVIRGQELEAANKRMAKFLATMTHELRTPLNGVLGMSSLLLEDTEELTEVHRDYLNTIKVSSDFLLTVINNILDFSKLESSMMTLDYEPVNIRESIEVVMNLLAPTAAAADLELYYNVDSALPELLVMDGTRLVQIIVNLTANAIKFTPEGYVAISVDWSEEMTGSPMESESEMITDTHSAMGMGVKGGRTGRVTVTVEDTGMGISQENQAKLFNAYTQLETNNKKAHGGTGLGLAISYHLVQLMKGRIWIESEGVPGKGSKFKFSLPLATTSAAFSFCSPRQQSNEDTTTHHNNNNNNNRNNNNNITLPRMGSLERCRMNNSDGPSPLSPRGVTLPPLTDVKVFVVSQSEISRDALRNICNKWCVKELYVTSSFLDLSCYWPKENSDGLPCVLIVDLPAGKSSVDGNKEIISHVSQQDWNGSVILLMPSASQSLFVPPRFNVLKKPLKYCSLYNTISQIISALSPAEEKRSATRKRKIEKIQPVKKSSVLVADDNMVNQKVLVHMLKRLGYQNITVVENGLDALNACRRESFDICLLDLVMPEMSGIEATQGIIELYSSAKKGERRPRLIAVTADATKATKKECLANGFDAFIPKPINKVRLEELLNKFGIA